MPHTKLSPTPWMVQVGEGKCEPNTYRLYDNNGNYHETEDRTLAMRRRNAKVMEAAPDLLDALKAFLSEADSWHDSTHPDGEANAGIHCDGICACRAAARAAIAKAEGKAV